MEMLIVHPENKDQVKVIKAFLKALKIGFESKQETPTYNPEFVEKIARSEADIKAGRLHKISLDEIWK